MAQETPDAPAATDTLATLREELRLVPHLREKFKLKPNRDVREPLLYAAVVESDIVAQLTPDVEARFGAPYKAAGAGAFWKNLFDPFVRAIGGIRRDQTLYRRAIGPEVTLYCAYWPWGSNPVKTSIRIGVLCPAAMTDELAAGLADLFAPAAKGASA